jgi:hypothetical protein
MPAIFGALTAEPEAVDFGDLADLRILPEQRVDFHDFGALRMASVERAGDPARLARCAASGAVLLVKGILDLRADRLPEDARIEGHRQAAAVLGRILEGGRAAAAGLPGHYVAIFWEPDLARLSLMTDELGLYPVYAASCGRNFLFGTQTRPFERARGFRREPDPGAVLELLRVEHLLGGRSMIRGASLVPGGAVFEVRLGARPTARVVRDPFRDREPPPRSPEDAVRALGAAYDQAFARATPRRGPLVIPLSGGRDSRTILCETLRAAPDARARTSLLSLGSLDQWDARCARRLARAVRMPWRLVAMDPPLHDRWLTRYVELMDGTSNMYATWWAAIMEAVADPKAVISCGFLGDALSGAHLFFYHPAFERPRGRVDFDPGVEYLLERLGRRAWSRDSLARTLRREVAAEWLDEPARTLRTSHFELGAAPRHVRMLRTDVIHRQRRFIASQLHLYRQRHRVEAPLGDPAVIQALLALGEDEIRDQAAYSRTLAARHPRAARVMEARYQRPIAGRRRDRFRCRAEVLALKAWERARGRLLGAPWPEREFLNFRHVYRDDIALDVSPLERFFDPDALRAELRREEPSSNRVRILYTLRAWLRGERAPASTGIARRGF